VISPIAALKSRPAGKVAGLAAVASYKANTYGVVPPLATTGIDAVIAASFVATIVATDCVATSALLIVTLNSCVSAQPLLSVTATLKVNEPTEDGVPENVPSVF